MGHRAKEFYPLLGQGDKPGEKGQGMGRRDLPGTDHRGFGLSSWREGEKCSAHASDLAFWSIVYLREDTDTDARNNHRVTPKPNAFTEGTLLKTGEGAGDLGPHQEVKKCTEALLAPAGHDCVSEDSSTYFPSFVELWDLFVLPFCLGLCLKTRKRFVASNANQETIGISLLLSLYKLL